MFNLNSIFNAIRTWLPTRCLLCRGHCQGPQPLCRGCRQELPWLGQQCQYCALPLPDTTASTCGECLRKPPPWQRCIAAFEYSSPIKQLIGRYKHRGDLACGRVLAELLAEMLDEQLQGAPRPDLLLPVPLHWRRQFMRGFNQSYDLARILSARLSIPCSYQYLRKQSHTAAQHNLPRNQRKCNLKGVFEVCRPVAGLHIVLIDDVVTTGSTARAATQALLKAGASEVAIWCMARTPR